MLRLSHSLVPYWFVLVIAISCFYLSGGTALAASATFSQQILPLNCSLDSVNNGFGVYSYVTPAYCNNVITPPLPNQVPSHPTVGLGNQGTQHSLSRAIPAESNRSNFPWQPIANTSKSSNQNLPASSSKADIRLIAATASSIVLVVALVVFAF